MSDDAETALAPTDERPRNRLIPLPPAPPDTMWSDVARHIAQQAQHARNLRKLATRADRAGRASTLEDPTLIAHILQGIADGLAPTRACLRIGLGHEAWSGWIRKAEQNPDSAYATLAEAAKGALAWREHSLLTGIETAGRSAAQHWTALAWLMERSPVFQRAYALNQGAQGGNVIVNIGVKDSEIRVGVGGESAADNGSDDDVIDVSTDGSVT